LYAKVRTVWASCDASLGLFGPFLPCLPGVFRAHFGELLEELAPKWQAARESALHERRAGAAGGLLVPGPSNAWSSSTGSSSRWCACGWGRSTPLAQLYGVDRPTDRPGVRLRTTGPRSTSSDPNNGAGHWWPAPLGHPRPARARLPRRHRSRRTTRPPSARREPVPSVAAWCSRPLAPFKVGWMHRGSASPRSLNAAPADNASIGKMGRVESRGDDVPHHW